MDKTFSHMSARAFCHATEYLERVKTAVVNITGDPAPSTRRVEGIHGNPIWIIESHMEGSDAAATLIRKMSLEDQRRIIDTIDSRLDDGCNLFIRFDKQSAFLGTTTLATNDDVVLVRLKVRAYPARPEVAKQLVREHILKEIPDRDVKA